MLTHSVRGLLGADSLCFVAAGVSLIVWRDDLISFGLQDSAPSDSGIAQVLTTVCGLQSGVLGFALLFTLALESPPLAYGLLGMVSLACISVMGAFMWHRDQLTSHGQLAVFMTGFSILTANAMGLMVAVAWPKGSPDQRAAKKYKAESQSGILTEPLTGLASAGEPAETIEVKQDDDGEQVNGKEGDSKELSYGTLKLLKLAHPHRAWLFAGCGALLFRLPFSISMAHWVSACIGCLNDGDYECARWNVMALFCAGTVDSIMDFWCVYLFGVAQQRIIRSLRIDLLKAITYQEIAFFDHTRTGEVTSRLTADTQEMANDLTWVRSAAHRPQV